MHEDQTGAPGSWHLDKRVNISIIVVLVGYAVAAVWQQAKIDSRIVAVETDVANLKRRDEAGQALDRDVFSKLASIEATLKILVTRMQAADGRAGSH